MYTFERAVVGKRIFVTRCLACKMRYGTPHEDVLLMIESIHRCPLLEPFKSSDNCTP